jgi:hypothetical protein
MRAIGKIALCVAAYFFGIIVTGAIAGALHLPSPGLPAGTTPQGQLLGTLIGTTLLVVGLVPLTMRLGSSVFRRLATLGLMIYMAVAINTLIEAVRFTNYVKIGLLPMCLHLVLPCLFLSGALAYCFHSDEPIIGLPAYSPWQWAWRITLAWLAFPVVYFIFGMCVAPFVMYAYRAGIAGLTIPPMAVIIRTQLLRSALFLVSSVPILALWTGSRRSLFLAFGFAEAMMVGIHGLAQAYWLPTVLRLAHSIEITFDSFAYIGVLALLFTVRKQSEPIESEAAAPREDAGVLQ